MFVGKAVQRSWTTCYSIAWFELDHRTEARYRRADHDVGEGRHPLSNSRPDAGSISRLAHFLVIVSHHQLDVS